MFHYNIKRIKQFQYFISKMWLLFIDTNECCNFFNLGNLSQFIISIFFGKYINKRNKGGC